MQRLTLLILMSLASVSTLAAQQHSDLQWQKFSSETGRFSVLLPETPTETSDTTPSEEGPYTTHLFISKSGAHVYAIGWVDYDPSFTFKPLNELDANRDNFIKGLSATLVSSRNLVINGFQSLEFTAETAESTFTSRVFIVGRRPYQIVVRSDKGLEDRIDTARFFDSFSVKP